MRRRRRSASTDSLELLLDTICNTFGGVLFIAILVVILLRMTGESKQETPESTVAPEQFQQQQNRLASLTAELNLLRKTRAGQQRLAEQFAEDEVREQIADRNELQQSFDQLQLAYSQQLQANAQESHKIEETRQGNIRTQKNLELAEKKADQLQEQLAQVRDSRVQEMRMPIVRSSGFRQEVALILRYGRMYVWHRYARDGTRLGLNAEEFVVLGTEGSALVTRPNPTAGVLLEDTPVSRGKIRERLSQFSPRMCVIAIIVRPDSYGHFNTLRDVLLDEGFEYRLMPMNEEGTVADRGGAGGKVQ